MLIIDREGEYMFHPPGSYYQAIEAMEITDAMLSWMNAHRDDDTMKLRMRYRESDDAGKIAFMILQIECRRKAAKKLPELVSNPRIVFPTSLSVEQCTSELLAREHSLLISEGDRVLDLTCGLGIDAFAICSRASGVVAIERDKGVAQAVEINAATLGITNITVVNDSCEEYLSRCCRLFDCMFVDPARRGEMGQRLYALGDCSPDIVSLLSMIRQHSPRLIIKASPMLDIWQVMSELSPLTAVNVYGTTRECKELVLILDFDRSSCPIKVSAITVGHGFRDEVVFDGLYDSESCNYRLPVVGDYLYEPYPAVMKTGCFNQLASKFGVAKLQRDTHLYLSSSIVDGFPGECFVIDEIIPFSSKEIKAFKKRRERMNVATRNFRIKAEQLKKQLAVIDGGDKMLFGVTLADNSAAMIIAHKHLLQ